MTAEQVLATSFVTGEGTLLLHGDLSSLVDLSLIDTTLNIVIDPESTLTLTAAQASDRVLSGAGTLEISSFGEGSSPVTIDLSKATTSALSFPEVPSHVTLKIGIQEYSKQSFTGPAFIEGASNQGAVQIVITATDVFNIGFLKVFDPSPFPNLSMTIEESAGAFLKVKALSGVSIDGGGTLYLYSPSNEDASESDLSSVIIQDVQTVGSGLSLTTDQCIQLENSIISGNGKLKLSGIIPIDKNLNHVGVEIEISSSNSLTMTASQASGLTLSGTGTLILSGDASTTDISTVTFLTTLEITSQSSLTLTPEQANGRTIIGAGTLILTTESSSIQVNVDSIWTVATLTMTTGEIDSILIDTDASLSLDVTQVAGKNVLGEGRLLLSGDASTTDLGNVSTALEITSQSSLTLFYPLRIFKFCVECFGSHRGGRRC